MVLNATECERLIDVVRAAVPSDWYEREIAKNQSSSKYMVLLSHPLAHMLWISQGTIEESLKSMYGIVSQEAFRLVVLGQNIELLRSKKVDGIDEKIAGLISKNFENTYYEIEVAASLVRLGHDVKFVKTKGESGVRTHDLLVDSLVEVECKKKEMNTWVSDAVRDLQTIAYRRVEEFMNRMKGNYAVYLKLFGPANRGLVDSALSQVWIMMKTAQEGRQVDKDYEVTVLRISDIDKIYEVPAKTAQYVSLRDSFSLNIPITESLLVDLIHDKNSIKEMLAADHATSSYSMVLDNFVKVSYPRIVAWSSKENVSRSNGIIASAKSAKGQFTGKNPALIYIQSSAIGPGMVPEKYLEARKEISDFFAANTRITGILVTTEVVVSNKLPLEFYMDATPFISGHARNPLPPDFVLGHRIDNSKELD